LPKSNIEKIQWEWGIIENIACWIS
jgi:hypothetical protein